MRGDSSSPSTYSGAMYPGVQRSPPRPRRVVAERQPRRREAGELHLAGPRDAHVARVHVAVDHRRDLARLGVARLVRRRERGEERVPDVQRRLVRERAQRGDLRERQPRHVLEHEQRLPLQARERVQLHHVRPRDARQRAGLARELARLALVGRRHVALQHDPPAEAPGSVGARQQRLRSRADREHAEYLVLAEPLDCAVVHVPSPCPGRNEHGAGGGWSEISAGCPRFSRLGRSGDLALNLADLQ